MKRVLQGFVLIGLVWFLTPVASAQIHETSSADITVTIVTELSLSKTIDLKLEAQSLDSLTKFYPAKAVRTGRISRKKQNNLQAKAELVPASFSLTGAGTYIYAVTIPAIAIAVNKKGEPIKVETYLSNKSINSSYLRPDSTITMGGKIVMASNQRKGTYVLVGGLDLAVNYN